MMKKDASRPYQFGIYWIGQQFCEISEGLSEISDNEYVELKPFFKDEKIFHGREAAFFEIVWTTVIGVTQGKIYKLSFLTPYAKNTRQPAGKDLFEIVTGSITDEFGSFSKQRRSGNSLIIIWDADWGNLILHSAPNPNLKGSPREKDSVLVITATAKFPFRRREEES